MKSKEKFNGDRLWFCSDLHINHSNVLFLNSGTRKFKDISEMNSWILEGLKSVPKNDTIIDLGDMFWNMDSGEIKNFMESIPCKNWYKVMGNHDKEKMYYPSQGIMHKYFKSIQDTLEVPVYTRNGGFYHVFASHTPSIDWPGMYRGGIHVYGHVHGHLDEWEKSNPRLMCDVGVDSHLAQSFGTPVLRFTDIIEYLKTKTGGLSFSKWIGSKFGDGKVQL